MSMRLLLLTGLLLVGGCAGTGVYAPATPENQEAARINLQLGLEYMQRGRLDLAEDKLNKAIGLDDRLPQAHNALGVLYTDSGRYDEAEAHYRRALAIDSDYHLARINYADMLCRAGRFQEGISEYTRVIERTEEGQQLRAIQGRGLCQVGSGELVPAEKDLRAVLEVDQFAPQALQGMAALSLQQGDPLRARGFLQRREATAPVTAESLWLGYQIEGALEDASRQEDYAVRLRTDFPDSDEASQLRRLMN